MNTVLRTLLLFASVLTAIWILRKIRKNRVKQEDAVYWICFAIILAIFGIFPEISFKMARILGIQSPSNFVFLAVICLLLEKLLSLSIQLSLLETKVETMAAELALRCKSIEEKQDNAIVGGKNANTSEGVINTDKL